MKKRIRIRTNLLPKPKKIMTRGLYEIINEATGKDVKKRDYGKRLK